MYFQESQTIFLICITCMVECRFEKKFHFVAVVADVVGSSVRSSNCCNGSLGALGAAADAVTTHHAIIIAYRRPCLTAGAKDEQDIC